MVRKLVILSVHTLREGCRFLSLLEYRARLAEWKSEKANVRMCWARIAITARLFIHISMEITHDSPEMLAVISTHDDDEWARVEVLIINWTILVWLNYFSFNYGAISE